MVKPNERLASAYLKEVSGVSNITILQLLPTIVRSHNYDQRFKYSASRVLAQMRAKLGTASYITRDGNNRDGQTRHVWNVAPGRFVTLIESWSKNGYEYHWYIELVNEERLND